MYTNVHTTQSSWTHDFFLPFVGLDRNIYISLCCLTSFKISWNLWDLRVSRRCGWQCSSGLWRCVDSGTYGVTTQNNILVIMKFMFMFTEQLIYTASYMKIIKICIIWNSKHWDLKRNIQNNTDEKFPDVAYALSIYTPVVQEPR
jgi:hypothetical protein